MGDRSDEDSSGEDSNGEDISGSEECGDNAATTRRGAVGDNADTAEERCDEEDGEWSAAGDGVRDLSIAN